MQRIVIVGCGGMGREALWIVREHNRAGRTPHLEVAGFVTSDSAMHGTAIDATPVLGPEDWVIEHPDVHVVLAIGNPRARRRIAAGWTSHAVRYATLIHPSVSITGQVVVGDGTIVSAGAVVTTDLRIGQHVIVNVHASIMHDAALEDFATLSPGVTVAGHAIVDYGAEMGTHSCVLPQQRVGRGAVIGAGAVVTSEIPPNTVAMGVPATVTRTLPKEAWL